MLSAVLLGGCGGVGANFEGEYENVVYVEEAGDLVGYKLAILENPTPSVFFTPCEGVCEGVGARFPTKVDGDSLTFTYVRWWISNDPEPLRYRVTKEGDNVILTSPDIPTLREVLPPAKPALRR